jgi:hypothetical protein
MEDASHAKLAILLTKMDIASKSVLKENFIVMGNVFSVLHLAKYA